MSISIDELAEKKAQLKREFEESLRRFIDEAGIIPDSVSVHLVTGRVIGENKRSLIDIDLSVSIEL